MGDYHVRFCERLGVKFPLSTRHNSVIKVQIKDNMKDSIKKDIIRFKKESEKIINVAYQDTEKFKKDWQEISSNLEKEE